MPSSAATAYSVGAEAEYWDALLAGELRLQRCAGCKTWHWPAVFRCAECGSWEHEWEPVALTGKVYSWTRTWHAFGGIESIGKPFVIAVVALEGGGGARLVGIMDDPGDVHVGQPVRGRITTTPFGAEQIPSIRWLA